MNPHVFKNILPAKGLGRSLRTIFEKASPHALFFFLFGILSFMATGSALAGPTLVKEITPGSSGTVFGSTRLQMGAALYFVAADNAHGQELWRTDGTETGTVMVRDINPGTASSTIASMAALNGILYFSATDGANGRELWRSDGSEGGTYMLKDIYSGALSSSPAHLTVLNNTLYFRAQDSSGTYLWSSDGTATGTTNVWTGGPTSPYGLTVMNNVLFFAATDADGTELWKLDGQNYVQVADINPGIPSGGPIDLMVYSGELYFQAADGVNGQELWKSDGTSPGTAMVHDINPAGDGMAEDYIGMVEAAGLLYFVADDGTNGVELWRTDGTKSGTVLVKDISPTSSEPSQLTNLGGKLFFNASDGVNGRELWLSDGSAPGTTMIEISPGPTSGNPLHLTIFDSALYFSASDSTNGTELWQLENLAIGPVLTDLNPGTGSSAPFNLTPVNGNLLFIATNGTTGTELFKLIGSSPTVSHIDKQFGQENAAIGPISFTIADQETAAAALIVSATSSNQTVLPDANITFAGSGSSRTITVTPAANQIGSSFVTVSVSDGTNTSTDIFLAVWGPVGIGMDRYRTIQDGVTASQAGDTVLVAPGRHTGTGNKNIDFGGKAIVLKSERGPIETIIDLEHVGTGFLFETGETAQTVVDGFSIINGGGVAIFPSTATKGGAIHIRVSTSPTIQNCILANNRADHGGGLYVDSGNSAPTIKNTKFLGNFSRNNGGGALFVAGSPTIENSYFSGNHAISWGGGISSEGTTSVTLTNATFVKNQAGKTGAVGLGGAVYASGTAVITNSSFIENKTIDTTLGSGGGVALNASPGATLSHCSFSDNTSPTGQAVELLAGTATITNSIVWGGQATGTPSVSQIHITSGTLTVENSDLEGGVASIGNTIGTVVSQGVNLNDDPLFALPQSLKLLPTSPAIDAGTATPVGGLPVLDAIGVGRNLDGDSDGSPFPDMGAFEFQVGQPNAAIAPEIIQFSVVHGSGVPDGQSITVKNSGSGTISWILSAEKTADWLRVEPTSGLSGTSSSRVDLFVEANRLALMSPGIYLSQCDIVDATTMVTLKTIPVQLTIHKLIRVHPGGQGDTTTIQAAIDAAADGDVVQVAPGTYNEKDITIDGKTITLRSENGPAYTIVDPANTGRGFIITTGGNNSIIEGFTVTNGLHADHGGGMYIDTGTSPTIVNSHFISNSSGPLSGRKGGAIYSLGKVVIRNCQFSSNTASFEGGGVYLEGHESLVDDSVFSQNSVTLTNGRGGGLYIDADDVLVNGSSFSQNSSTAYGGGVAIDGQAAGAKIYNSFFEKNTTGSAYGGGIDLAGAESSVVNTIFSQNHSDFQAGALYIHNFYIEIINCSFFNNTSADVSGVKDGAYNQGSYTSLINLLGFHEDGTAPINNLTSVPSTVRNLVTFTDINDHPFVDPVNGDFRVDPLSPAAVSIIDQGSTVNWLFSDQRGSLRPIDGDGDGKAAFDIGAIEYSEYFGGLEGDLPTKAFANVRIDSSIIATGYEYNIRWDDRDPLPESDKRINQAGEYSVNVALISAAGLRVELGTRMETVSQVGYTFPVVFGSEHIGQWRLRVEMTSDPNQFELSEPITIEYKKAQTYYYGTEIPPPNGADITQKPDVEDESVVYWSVDSHRLFAIGGPKTMVITWFAGEQRTVPLPTLVNVTYPPDSAVYIAGSPAVDLLPSGTAFESVQLKFADNDAAASAGSFSANIEGWSVLLFTDNEGLTADDREVFEVVRTLEWDHNDPLAPADPVFPAEQTAVIGTALTDAGHDTSCGNGYVFFEKAYYDGYGTYKAYDRLTRQGPIFPVNRDLTGIGEGVVGGFHTVGAFPDDLVVVWYEKSVDTGICWPYSPVRYDPQWPTPTAETTIYIDSEQGSGPLPAPVYGVLEDMLIYNQPDPSQPGFNPNEEHASFFTAQGSSSPGVFPLRTDINRPETSEPYVLLKYKNPQTGIWDMAVFMVMATEGKSPFTYTSTAGNEMNAPYPLNQMVFGPCSDSSTTTPQYVLKDKDNKLFSYRGGVSAVIRYYYKLQTGFYYDLDGDRVADAPDGACIAWLDGYSDGVFNGVPVDATYSVIWDSPLPTLAVGETLVASKTQQGETVSLPEIGSQCKVDILYDDNGIGQSAKLIDPLTEYAVQYVLNDPENQLPLKPKMDLSSGRFIFTALPYHLQTRLTYDPAAEGGSLKLKGTYSNGVGEPFLLLNVLSQRELNIITTALAEFPGDSAFSGNIDILNALGKGADGKVMGYDSLRDVDIKALSAGDAQGIGHVTLAFNNDPACPAPTTLAIINVGCGLYKGDIKVIESPNPFEEKVTLHHNGDFGGNSDNRKFQWEYKTVGAEALWLPYEPAPTSTSQDLDGLFYDGAVETIIQGTGQQLLPDKWFRARYYYDSGICATNPGNPADPGNFSEWTAPQLYEGWIKRVMKKINLFDQKVTEFHAAEANTLSSMVSLAGGPEKDIALSDDPAYLQSLGMIETYATLLNRGLSLTEDGGDFTSLNQALLFAANRLADLYMVLGNEAYADSADPTIGFSTENGVYGSEASSVFSFQNQVDSMLDEELALLRGRDSLGVSPFYNRLIWNFTLGDGEVAYVGNYNITDQKTVDSDGDTFADSPDGELNEDDARVQYPQGHGDAWGHYLSAVTKYYSLLKKDNFTWIPSAEDILVAGVPVRVDYRDERKFAAAAAAKAKTGAEIVNLTYRKEYTDDPEGQWQGYKDTDAQRAWGVDGWARRAAQGALFDWAVGNAMLPAEYQTEEQVAGANQTLMTFSSISYTLGGGDLEVKVNGQLVGAGAYTETSTSAITFVAPLQAGDIVRARVVPNHSIEKVDRTTVTELWEIAATVKEIHQQVDNANIGLNPLGLAKNVVPFDIDPSAVAAGQTHFEQIYGRAVQGMNNAIAVFNHANESTQLLRRQQDSLADFQRNVENMEADYNNRLIEVFGYPYADDCGANKTYETDYCQSGPDLFHYMYVDTSTLMGFDVPRAHDFEVTMHDYADNPVDASGGLQFKEKQVIYHIDTDSRFGIIKPSNWVGSRKASGELQAARSELLQLRGSFDKSLQEYSNLIDSVQGQASLISAQYGLNQEEIFILNAANQDQNSFNTSIADSMRNYYRNQFRATVAKLASNAAAEALPLSVGFSTDATSFARSLALLAGNAIIETQIGNGHGYLIEQAELGHKKEDLSNETNIKLTTKRGDFAIKQQLLQLENLVRSEKTLAYDLDVQAEALKQSAQRYLSTLAKGQRLMMDRLRFRQQTAAQIQEYRYKDMSFRIFRNDALQKYRAQFDMAAMYVYLAAKAYDYETTLLDSSTMAGQNFLTDIVKQRTIGMIENGQPLTGSGLADPMKRMWQNFQVLKPQMGFNNPQVETNRFSMREELFRIQTDATSNDHWRQELLGHTVADLWDVPEYRRYCRPFDQEGLVEPGIVIPFDTTVTSGLNFFRWPLGGGDSYYDSSNFATKIGAVGIWLSNYNAAGLAQTPRVYLVPAGEDILRAPSYNNNEVRSWKIIDQKLPQPFPIVPTEMAGNSNWIPTVDTIFEDMFEIRRHSRFRAYHDSGYLNLSEMQYDTRLIGRSVWNTKWLLIIPGRSLLADPVEGISTFIHGPLLPWGKQGERTGNGISDIKLFFKTYSYSGN